MRTKDGRNQNRSSGQFAQIYLYTYAWEQNQIPLAAYITRTQHVRRSPDYCMQFDEMQLPPPRRGACHASRRRLNCIPMKTRCLLRVCTLPYFYRLRIKQTILARTFGAFFCSPENIHIIQSDQITCLMVWCLKFYEWTKINSNKKTLRLSSVYTFANLIWQVIGVIFLLLWPFWYSFKRKKRNTSNNLKFQICG